MMVGVDFSRNYDHKLRVVSWDTVYQYLQKKQYFDIYLTHLNLKWFFNFELQLK